ncbi:MAG: Nif11-like leader peptide family RiPP precursor, partial [Christensenellaceae bacterium]|nr:Nif11-like leader peptide family RiPP precursor [Christensenellaceae bacterium]
MQFSKELIEKAKTAKSAEELLAMAKAENIELTEEEAAKAFAELNKSGELSDEELNNVSGGCGSGDEPLFTVGQWVYV